MTKCKSKEFGPALVLQNRISGAGLSLDGLPPRFDDEWLPEEDAVHQIADRGEKKKPAIPCQSSQP